MLIPILSLFISIFILIIKQRIVQTIQINLQTSRNDLPRMFVFSWTILGFASSRVSLLTPSFLPPLRMFHPRIEVDGATARDWKSPLFLGGQSATLLHSRSEVSPANYLRDWTRDTPRRGIMRRTTSRWEKRALRSLSTRPEDRQFSARSISLAKCQRSASDDEQLPKSRSHEGILQESNKS